MSRVSLLVVVLAACSSEPDTSTDVSEVRRNVDVTRIRVNGESVDSLLSDPETGTNGFINVARDNVNNTTSLDFSYATPTSDPDFITLVQGAGEIPNEAFTTTQSTAQLTVVTPFPVVHCLVNIVTAEFTCEDGAPIPFDLFWEQNGYSEVEEHIRRREKIGPLTVSFRGSFDQRSALVNGTWNGNTAVDMSGNLLETRNTTVIREIMMQVQ